MKTKNMAQLKLRMEPDIKDFIDNTKTEYKQTSMQGFVMFMVREFMKHHYRQQEDE